jgi:hypothetical protein
MTDEEFADLAWDRFCLIVTAVVDRERYVARDIESPAPDDAYLGSAGTFIALEEMYFADPGVLQQEYAAWCAEKLPKIFGPEPDVGATLLKREYGHYAKQTQSPLKPADYWTQFGLRDLAWNSGRGQSGS